MISNDALDCAKIDKNLFNSLVQPLNGLPVSYAWRGYGSAIFLELGELHERALTYKNKTRQSAKGQAAIMIEWSWRIERPRSIECGSWSGDIRIANAIKGLEGLSVESIAVDGRLPEIAVCLSDGRVIQSFMTAEGQPAWTIFLDPAHSSWIEVRRGCLQYVTTEP